MNTTSKIKLGLLGWGLRMLRRETRRRLGVHLGVPDIRWSLMELKRFGFYPQQVMDAGAFNGDWARICLDIFPESTLTCVEPQDSVQAELQALASAHSNVRTLRTLLGRQAKEGVPFEENGPGSSVLTKGQSGIIKPMTTIDILIEQGIFKPPELLKLDVQGYELEILEGYTRYFAACQVIQCELSLLPLIPGTPLLHEVIPYLYQRGFVMFDVEELVRDPGDGAVWQIDALFCRTDSPLRTGRSWR